MLCVSIQGPSLQDACRQIEQALEYAKIIELRLDLFQDRSPEKLKELLKRFAIPMIFTLRSKKQGGGYEGTEASHLLEIEKLLACQPAYFDLESDTKKSFLLQVQENYPEVQMIISLHTFESDLKPLKAYLDKMPMIERAWYKIAVFSTSTLQTLQFLNEGKRHKKLILVSMGENGQISRILSPILGAGITYSCLDENTPLAPGQLPAKTLQDVYCCSRLHSKTHIYGLIGDPVSQSIGHLTHNHVMSQFNLDAVYVKMRLAAEELTEALSLMSQLEFKGLSVTMPLKEKILDCLDDVDEEAQKIGAVNTVLFEGGKVRGFNTDGVGAIDSLEVVSRVAGKKVLILGAGGAARAIAYEAIQRGAKVILLNRDQSRVQAVAKNLCCEGDTLDKVHAHIKNGYDILINTIPKVPQEVVTSFIQGALVMDIISSPMETEFLQAARQSGCTIIPGYQMFIRQAMRQFQLWFPHYAWNEQHLNVWATKAENILGFGSI